MKELENSNRIPEEINGGIVSGFSDGVSLIIPEVIPRESNERILEEP